MKDPRKVAAALFGRTTPAPAPGPAGPVRPSWSPGASLDQIEQAQAIDADWAAQLAAEFEAVPFMSVAERSHIHKPMKRNLDYIHAPGPAAGHHGDDEFFRHLVRHQWRSGTVPAGAQQRSLLAGHRPASASSSTPDYSRLKFGAPARETWDNQSVLDRVNAFTYRGDARDPLKLKAHGGFMPPASRTDAAYVATIAAAFVTFMDRAHGKTIAVADVIGFINGQGKRGQDFVRYQMWRQMYDNQKYNISSMVADEFLKGYISTSRDVSVAIGFAASNVDGADAWVYAVHTEGGFLLPVTTTGPVGTSCVTCEAEVAHPGRLGWDKIVGVARWSSRELKNARMGAATSGEHRHPTLFYYRHGFRTTHPDAFQRIQAAFSTACRPVTEVRA